MSVPPNIDVLLAARAALDVAITQAQGEAGSLKTEETGGVPSIKGDVMARASVIKDRNGWRVRIIDKATGKGPPTTSYATKDEAEKAKTKLLREYERPVGVSIRKALAEYKIQLAAGGADGEHPNRPRTLETTMGRIASVLGRKGECITGDLTPTTAEAAWKTYCETPGRRSGSPPAIDTKKNTLKQIRTFFKWCIEKGWMKADPLASTRVVGERKTGKDQLAGVDESNRFLAKALELGRTGDAGAIAAAIALIMGMRASEISDRVVGQLDAKGTILIITRAKTKAGNRRLMIPALLQPLLQQLAAGRSADQPLFKTDKGKAANRHWVLRAVVRVAKEAGLVTKLDDGREVTVKPHGLRGTHATLARAAGGSGPLVAESLGHESEITGVRHYIADGTVQNADTAAFLAALN